MTEEHQPPDGVQRGPRIQNWQRQLVFWLIILIVFLAFVSVFSSILMPFVAGMALAYLLDPIADWFERRGLSRLAATLIILAVFLALFVGALLLLIPALIDQLTRLVERLPELVADLQNLVQPLLESEFADYLGIEGESLPDQIAGFVGSGSDWIIGLLGSIWSGGQALIGILSLLIVTPVVAFYLLYDWDRMIEAVDSWLPRQHAGTLRELGHQMSEAISGFIRGQGLVVVILSVFYAASLAAIGLNFGLVIGLIAGFFSFIPFIGTMIGLVASVGVALAQWAPEGEWIWVVATAVIFGIGQLAETNYLQPKLVGGSVGLHPVWLIFAIFAFTLMFGFVGTLIAVPAAAIVAVLVRFGLRQYLASPFHGGGAAADAATDAERPDSE